MYYNIDAFLDFYGFTWKTFAGVVVAAVELEPRPDFAGDLRNGFPGARCCRTTCN
jgi:hypothetical protein